jgi:hypothetical protein
MAPFPPVAWLAGCCIWLGLSIFHPTTNSLGSGVAQAMMYIAVLSPVFWVPAVVRSERQLARIMMLAFVTNAVSAMLGVGQVYSPKTFNPPAMVALAQFNPYAYGSLIYTAADGREVIRPCGLSDNPGQASPAGMVTCLIGLCLATRPMALWKRLMCLGLALAGMDVIYLCQIRTSMVMELVCILTVVGLFLARGHVRQAAMLVVGISVVLFGAAAWAVSAVGEISTKRFMSLVEEKPTELYFNARGNFVQNAFDVLIWKYPLGAGLGRYGMAHSYFGNYAPGPGSGIWVEVQWPGWIVDGGIPLLVAYAVALALAMLDSFRVVWTCRDKELAFWGAMGCATNLAILATTFSQCPFIANSGGGFWLTAAVLHAAGECERMNAKAQRVAVARRH